ncbi:MAG: SDR family NAD(P)-dependent oxidoreductase [Pseudomonadota bacterium]
MAQNALVVGAGAGISASFARALAKDGYRVALSARNTDKLADLEAETGGLSVPCDVAEPDQVAALFERLDKDMGRLDVVLYNPSARVRGPLVELDPDGVRTALMVSAYGAFLVGQQAARRMTEAGGGAIFFTGATAGIKGYPQSAPFAMGKFALRGLAQSMARELGPKNIHVAHFVIDGGVHNVARGYGEEGNPGEAWLDPDAIAQTYMAVLKQPRSAWAFEVDLRPWVEGF